jgi:hypothetical protein
VVHNFVNTLSIFELELLRISFKELTMRIRKSDEQNFQQDREQPRNLHARFSPHDIFNPPRPDP